MRAHPKIAEQYASLKRSVASACKDDIDKYCDGKANFVSIHEKLALKWWENA